MIRIVPKFTKADIQKILKEKQALIEKAILSRLQFVGESFVKNARENGDYNDITGNLRNSIGYVILKDGRQLVSNFRKSAKIKSTIKKGKNAGKEKISSGNSDGVKTGQDLAESIGRNYPKGYVLIVVAGMDYAAAVESLGKDVLTSSSQIATRDLNRAMMELTAKIGKMK